MSLRTIRVVYGKEMTDTLRDRRTLVSQILVPILLFPVMILGMIALSIFVLSKVVRENPRVMILGAEHAPALVEALQKNEELEVVPPSDDYAQRINDKKLRAALLVPRGFDQALREGRPQTLTIYHFQENVPSERIAQRIETTVRNYADSAVEARLAARGLPASFRTPFTFKRENVASEEKVSGAILGMIVPYFIIILALTGAMYPAMDLTAGEKERGTLETLMASPARRLDLVVGKFLVVFTASVVTTALAVASFSITAIGAGSLLQEVSTNFVLVVSGKAAAAVFFLILPLGLLFSAGLVTLSILARNYREAQTYVMPLMFLVIFPAMASFVPGIELNARLAMIPVLNISLVSKEVFAGNYPWPLIGVVFGSTLVYASLALAFAVRQFHRETVLFRT